MYAVSREESKHSLELPRERRVQLRKVRRPGWESHGSGCSVRMVQSILTDFAHSILGVPIEAITNFPIENGNKSYARNL